MQREFYVSSSNSNGSAKTFFKRTLEVKDTLKPLSKEDEIRSIYLTHKNYGLLPNGVVTRVETEGKDSARVEKIWIEVESPTDDLRACLTEGEGWKVVKL